MARQYTHPKQPRNATWYKKKAMLAEAQEAGQILDEEQLAFLADPGFWQIKLRQSSLTMLLSRLRILIHNKISSDSNIIPYSQYLQETQQATVQDTNLQAQQDSMLTKLQAFYDNTHKQALGYQNLFYLKKAQRIKPTLYDGVVMSKTHVAMPMIDDEETLILEEESRSKMSKIAKDPEVVANKFSHKPIDYEKLNSLTADFEKCFSPQQELSSEQAFWFHIL
ncbi:hypothetical protein Tco_0106445, partial [Tanacetum coccineum]